MLHLVKKANMPPPKAVVCYICGRQYMLHSCGSHEAQCRELFEKREALKPPKERRALPPSPFATKQQSVSKGGSSSGKAGDFGMSMSLGGGSAYGDLGRSSSHRSMPFTVDSLNEMTSNMASSMLQQCPHCSRRFNDVSYPR